MMMMMLMPPLLLLCCWYLWLRAIPARSSHMLQPAHTADLWQVPQHTLTHTQRHTQRDFGKPQAAESPFYLLPVDRQSVAARLQFNWILFLFLERHLGDALPCSPLPKSLLISLGQFQYHFKRCGSFFFCTPPLHLLLLFCARFLFLLPCFHFQLLIQSKLCILHNYNIWLLLLTARQAAARQGQLHGQQEEEEEEKTGGGRSRASSSRWAGIVACCGPCQFFLFSFVFFLLFLFLFLCVDYSWASLTAASVHLSSLWIGDVFVVVVVVVAGVRTFIVVSRLINLRISQWQMRLNQPKVCRKTLAYSQIFSFMRWRRW